MKLLFPCIFLFVVQLLSANDEPKVEGIWTCSKKDCKVEVYKTGNTYEAKLLWARKELDKNGKPKLDSKNRIRQNEIYQSLAVKHCGTLSTIRKQITSKMRLLTGTEDIFAENLN